jgi:PII-like signaling protein
MQGFEGERVLMRIHIEEQDRYQGKPLYEHRDRVIEFSLDVPVVVECAETEEKIRAILPELDEMIGGGLITLERIQVVAP